MIGTEMRSQQTTLTLMRAYRQLYQAQEKVREAVERYGAASREAREAQVMLRERELQLQLTRRQLITAIMQQYYAYVMLVAGAVPVVINLYRLMVDVQAIRIAKTMTEIYAERQLALERLLGIAALRQSAIGYLQQAAAAGVSSVAVRDSSYAQIQAVVTGKMLEATNYAVGVSFGFMAAMARLAISALAVIGINFLLLKVFECQATQELKKFEEQAKRLTATLTVHSLDDSLERIIKLTRESGEQFRFARARLEELRLHARALETTPYPPISVTLNVSPRQEARYRQLAREVQNAVVETVKRATRTRW